MHHDKLEQVWHCSHGDTNTEPLPAEDDNDADDDDDDVREGIERLASEDCDAGEALDCWERYMVPSSFMSWPCGSDGCCCFTSFMCSWRCRGNLRRGRGAQEAEAMDEGKQPDVRTLVCKITERNKRGKEQARDILTH